MTIKGSDFLFIKKDADFIVYDKRSDYIYPIDSLHYHIGTKLKDEYNKNRVILSSDYFIREIEDYTDKDISEHYDFVLQLLSKEQAYNINPIKNISEQDIIQSISTVPQIVIEVTEKCNFQCRYCYYGEMYNTVSTHSERNHDMPEEDCIDCLKFLLSKKNLLHSNKLELSFYGGEPLMNFSLIREIISLCKREFPEIVFQFSMTTNGSLLNRHIDYLKENDFRILVSLDGDEEADRHRVYKNNRCSFSRVNENLKLISKKYPEYFANKIGIISVLHKDSDIVSICDFFSQYKKTPVLTEVSQEGVIPGREKVLPYNGVSDHEMTELYEKHKDVYDLVEEASKLNSSLEITDKISLLSQNPYLRGCFLFAKKIFLTVDGMFYPCEKVNRRFPFGTFLNGKIQFDLKKINEYYDQFNRIISRECSGCSLHYICKKCFFEEPSAMCHPMKCKMTDKAMEIRLINSL